MTIIISFNKDLFLLIILAVYAIMGLIYVAGGIFLNGHIKDATWSGWDVLTGCIHLAIVLAVLIL